MIGRFAVIALALSVPIAVTIHCRDRPADKHRTPVNRHGSNSGRLVPSGR
jgi:hypothetical protein